MYSLLTKCKTNILTKIYYSQIQSSKRRGHKPPEYTKEEFINYFINNEEFNNVFNTFLESGCKNNLKPSIDRLDDFKHYSFDNIRACTIKENESKGHNDKRLGIGTQGKCCKKVLQYDLNGKLLAIFPSSAEASRQLGLFRQNINKVCKGQRKTSGNYIFKYSE